MPTEMKSLRQLEEKNDRYKMIVTDLSWDKDALQDPVRKALKSARRCELLDKIREVLALERICRIVGYPEDDQSR